MAFSIYNCGGYQMCYSYRFWYISTTKSRGLAVGWEKLFEFGLALPALTLYAYIGLFYSFIYDTIMVVIGGIVLYLLSFETKDKTLETNAMHATKKFRSESEKQSSGSTQKTEESD